MMDNIIGIYYVFADRPRFVSYETRYMTQIKIVIYTHIRPDFIIYTLYIADPAR